MAIKGCKDMGLGFGLVFSGYGFKLVLKRGLS